MNFPRAKRRRRAKRKNIKVKILNTKLQYLAENENIEQATNIAVKYLITNKKVTLIQSKGRVRWTHRRV